MNLLMIISIIWLLSEILLSRFMRANDSHNNYDKSSLKILWITISLSITLGILLSNSDYALTQRYTIFIYNSGVFLICCGLLIRWLAILKLKKYFTVNVSVNKNQDIIQSGIYRYIRHPAYLGSLLSFLGLAIVFNNGLTFVIIFIPILFSFLYRIHIEERLLSRVFDASYTKYIKNSWKLIPWIF